MTVMTAGAVLAQEAAPGEPPLDAAPEGAGLARMAISPAAEGLVLYDRVAGALSYCGRFDGVWRCLPIREEDHAAAGRNGVRDELAPLAERLDALAAQISALAAVPPEPGNPATAALTEAGLSAAGTSAGERILSRLFRMVEDWKR